MSDFIEKWKALFENKEDLWIHPESTENFKAIAALQKHDNLYYVFVHCHGTIIQEKFNNLIDATSFGVHWYDEFSKRIVAGKFYIYGTMYGGLEISHMSNGDTLTREEAIEFIRACQERMKR